WQYCRAVFTGPFMNSQKSLICYSETFQNLCHKFGLALSVRFAIAGKSISESPFQVSVCVSILGMPAEIISKRDVLSVRIAVGRADVEVVRKSLVCAAECLTAANSQISLVCVSNRS